MEAGVKQIEALETGPEGLKNTKAARGLNNKAAMGALGRRGWKFKANGALGTLIAIQVIVEGAEIQPRNRPVEGFGPNSRVVEDVLIFEDESGKYKIQSKGWFFKNWSKSYLNGDGSFGKRIPISEEEKDKSLKEYYKKNGRLKLDFWERKWKWTPGTERSQPEEIFRDGYLDPLLGA